MEKTTLIIFFLFCVAIFTVSCQKYGQNETGLRQFIADYEQKIEPLSKQYNQAHWDAYITGKKEYFDQSTATSLKIDAIYQVKTDFKYLKSLNIYIIFYNRYNNTSAPKKF